MTGPVHPRWGPLAFVWGTWAVLLSAALAYVAHYSRNVPFMDDWMVVPVLTGNQSLTLQWLFESVGEHRQPLPRLLVVALYRLSGYDFRSGEYFNVLALGMLAFGMILAAKSVRGWTSYPDAFFPLVFLHFGYCDIFLRGWMATFVLPVVLAGLLFFIVVQKREQLPLGTALVAAILLAMMGLSDAPGVAYVPAMSLWLGYWGVRHYRSGRPWGKGKGLAVFGLVVATLLTLPVFFIGYDNADIYGTRDLAGLVKTFVGYYTLSFGPAAGEFWPYSAAWVVALELMGAALLIHAGWRMPQPERGRALGLLLFTGAAASLAAGLTWGRATTGWLEIWNPEKREGGYEYMAFTAPGICCLYFVWLAYGPKPWGRLFPIGLCATLIVLMPFNTQEGKRYGQMRLDHWEKFETDLKAKEPPYVLLARHTAALLPGSGDHVWLSELIQMLRQARIGGFRDLPDNPPFDEVAIPFEPTRLHKVKWKEGVATTSSGEGFLTFTLPQPMYVAGIRFRYTQDTHGIAFRMLWRKSGQARFPQDGPQQYDDGSQEYFMWPLGYGLELDKEQSLLIYVADIIDQFRIYPDTQERCTFGISGIVVLVPSSRERAASPP